MSDHIQVIVKLVERCNLDCSYCYMYHGADQSWKSRPALLSKELRKTLIDRCQDYLREDAHREVTLEFHGGEPLMMGLPAFRSLVGEARNRLGNRAHFCIQTNGLLLNEDWGELFGQEGIAWSISCDGPAAVNDKFRLDHMGRGSSTRVEAAITLSESRNSPWFGGVLAVIDPQTSAREVIQYFRELGVKDLDLLMPDASHHQKPNHLQNFSPAQVRDYLIEAFEEWIEIGDPKFRIRTFTHIMKALFGKESGLDAFGGQLWAMMVVESDGSFQHLDVMRINGEEEVQTGMTVDKVSFDEFLLKTKDAHPDACATCKACPIFKVCGGGYLPHRFDGESYDNPSVYCETLYGLIGRINNHLRYVTPVEIWRDVNHDTGLQHASELAP